MENTGTEKFIEAVKEYPMLYDLNNENYRNKVVSNNKWNEIGKLLDISGEVAKKKWKGLRDSYTKYLRATRSTGRVAAALNRYKSWPWAENMSFLRSYIDGTQTDSQIDTSNDVEDFEKRTSSPPATMRSSNSFPVAEKMFSLNKQKFKHKKMRGFSNSYNTRLKSEMSSSKRVQEMDDDIDLMFKSFAKTVKGFSPKRKIVLKAKLAKLMAEEELAHISELPVKCSSCALSVSDHWTEDNSVLTYSEKPVLDSVQNITDSVEVKAVHFLCCDDDNLK